MRAALELYRCRQYPCVVAVCADALDDEPDNIHLRLLLARGLLALRRDVEAQSHLRECLRLDSRCGAAYRLLGELALRRDELESARIFLREALRLDPGDREAGELLSVIPGSNQPTAAVEKLPAATAAVGCPSLPAPAPPPPRPRLALGTSSDVDDVPPRFGHYLVEIGALTPVQLRAALAYHRATGVRLGGAAAALGFISEPKVERAAMGFHGRRRSDWHNRR